MKTQQDIKEIISRINQGIASEEDIVQFQLWYNSFDDKETILDSNLTAVEFKDKNWAEIHRRIAPTKVRRLQWAWGVAAALLLLSTAVVWIWSIQQKGNSNEVFRSAAWITDASGQTQEISSSLHDFLDSTSYVDLKEHHDLRTLATAAGEFTKVILPDGTKVSLNAGSKIVLSPDYAKAAQRTISLEGEAYFEVVTIPGRSFVVKTADQQIKVLGTKFNVSAYPSFDKTITTLHEGKIELSNGSQNVILQPNNIVVNKDGALSLQRMVKLEKEAWRKLDFEFDNESIKTVLHQLSQWYGFELSYLSAVPNQHISGKIVNGTKTSDVLEIMKNLTNGNFQMKGNVLYVNFANN
jgi:ferric-dicitrate binding protein FerR (iron transport regulator)